MNHIKIQNDGSILWTNKDGQAHRNDGKPASIWPNGTIEYWINRKKYR